MFSSASSEKAFNQFFSAWADDGSGLRTLFSEIIRRLSDARGVTLDFTPHDHAGNTLRALRPGISRPIVALIEIPDDCDSPRSFSIRFYENAIEDPKELGEWIPRGICGEDARSFSLEADRLALADYLLARMAVLLGKLPE